MSRVRLIFPNQLFEANFSADKSTKFILIEDDLFFRQYPFHKQKLILHRASMREFRDRLKRNHFSVDYIETSAQTKSITALEKLLKKSDAVEYYDLVDDWLSQNLEKVFGALEKTPERLNSPGFLTTPGQIDDFFETGANRMQAFYEWQRKRLGILVDKNNKPTGGKWSFDEANRKKLPKNIELHTAYDAPKSDHIDEAKAWVEKYFGENPGEIEHFSWPVTHADAKNRLENFLENRLENFGPYEDAIAENQVELFHSVLSSLINIGLLTPKQVVDETIAYYENHDSKIESVEGFIRQIIGWREYMRAEYVRLGRKMRTKNHLGFSKKLPKSWWTGNVGIAPIDTVISRVLETAYAHHIERLMILGNSMVLLRIDPDDVYEWFMSLFIDAYDWVMVPNVYAMSQFAAGEMITTKPYVSGSNYLKKMSDFSASKNDDDSDWAEIWDALYWTFVKDYRQVFEQNYRSQMMVKMYDKQSAEKKRAQTEIAKKWL